ncbi:Integrase catalytic domain-containing protein [Abeliophyllum distichum]|uniref:Integrase catalytic domain-containing protein n=1 Tax=Abeliophyllum distichum TaxID=126358 RepID=A0ABD1PN10_9LAMI
MLSLGFNISEFDHCLYFKSELPSNALVFLLLYVDDMLTIGSCVDSINDIKAALSSEFEMKDDAGHEPETNHGSVNHGPVGTLTRSRAKKIKEDIQGLVKTLWTDADIKNMSLTDEVPTWVHLIQAKEGMEEQLEDKAKLDQSGQLCDRMAINHCDRNTSVSEAECI